MNRYFITGGSGFIGSHFHEVIPNSQIVNFDLVEPGFTNKSTYIKGDIRVYDNLETALINNPCDVILSLAAEHKDFGLQREDYFSTNRDGTINICKVASKLNINTIIFYSSVAVYGIVNECADEMCEPEPNLPYGESKLAGENVLVNWAKEDPNRRVIILRPAVVYGERNVANMFRLIQQINRGNYFNIGKGDNIKSIAYVKNLVDATLFLASDITPGIKLFNYSDDPQFTSRSIANILAESLDKKIKINLPYWLAFIIGLPFDLIIFLTGKNLSVSTDRIRKFCSQTCYSSLKIKSCGFEPKYSNKEGLQRMVNWFKNENYNGNKK